MAEKLSNTGNVNLILEEDLSSIHLDKKVSISINNSYVESLSRSKLSDKIAKVIRSWFFIISFGMILFLRVILFKPFDLISFILLSLALLCTAVLQVPVKVMRQNSQEQRNRIRGENEFIVNLKSKLNSNDLHNKLDKAIIDQEQLILRLESISTSKLIKQ